MNPPAGNIAYSLDGREVSRTEALRAWQHRDTSEVFTGSEMAFCRAEDTDSISALARDGLARFGITVRHLSPAEATAREVCAA